MEQRKLKFENEARQRFALGNKLQRRTKRPLTRPISIVTPHPVISWGVATTENRYYFFFRPKILPKAPAASLTSLTPMSPLTPWINSHS